MLSASREASALSIIYLVSMLSCLLIYLELRFSSYFWLHVLTTELSQSCLIDFNICFLPYYLGRR